MKNRILLLLFAITLLVSCEGNQENSIEKNKVEILRTERNFAEMAAKEGVAKAFLFYAAQDAVINRENRLIRGKENIKAYIESEPFSNITLKWNPEFVDVAKSGDMGYTYGKFFFSAIDTAGKVIRFKGPFHTVWKKQPDGNWRFVWD